MKKIILIIITLFLTTGCFNYLSLNDIAVVSLVHIDYQDNKYILTVEIRENEKDNPNASSIYTNQGITLDNTFENIGLTINKFLYLVDVDTIILTENVLNQHPLQQARVSFQVKLFHNSQSHFYFHYFLVFHQ